MMTCRDVTRLITDYLEGRMAVGTRLRFLFHIGMCRHCRAYIRQMKVTMDTLGSLPPEPPPPEVETALLQAFENWRREPSHAGDR